MLTHDSLVYIVDVKDSLDYIAYVKYSREWKLDWAWYDEIVADWEEQNKPDPTVADLLGLEEDD